MSTYIESILTAPDRNAPALQFCHYGAHGHGDRDGVKVGGVWRYGENGNFRGSCSLSFYLDPVETSTEPHGSHAHT